MYTPFDWALGINSGRLIAPNHVVDPTDSPLPAVIHTAVSGPYQIIPGSTLLVTVGVGLVQQITFSIGDFVSIEFATASEVATVITNNLIGATGYVDEGRASIRTDDIGPETRLAVIGGTAQNALQFDTVEALGAQSTYSVVLGSALPGRRFIFATGDQSFLHSTGTINDAKLWRLRGHAHWVKGGNEAGSSWKVTTTLDGVDHAVLPDSGQHGVSMAHTVSIEDMVVNLTGLAAVPRTIKVRLEATDTAGAGAFLQTLPAIILDYTTFSESAPGLLLGNRYPVPGMRAVAPSVFADVQFQLLDTTGVGVDLTETRVYVNQTPVYAAGAFVGPFSGSVTAGTGPASRDVTFSLDLSTLAPLTSEQQIEILVQSETTGAGSVVNEAWIFYALDTSAPSLVSAVPVSKTRILASFSEAMDTEFLPGVLSKDSYTVTPVTVPAYTPTVTGVVQISDTTFEVQCDAELTLRAEYSLQVVASHDLAGNVISTGANQVAFQAFIPTAVPGRSLNLWDALPLYDKREDSKIPGRPLKAFIGLFQDVVDLILCDIDHWSETFNIETAPPAFLRAILRDLGNPFTFVDLTDTEQRRLALNLRRIYAQKGTEVGVINAVRFLLGLDITLDIIIDQEFWNLGVDQMGVGTILGPPLGSYLWYSFYVVSPIVLTAQQKQQILKIVTYMKPAHEHILGLREPGYLTTTYDAWVLDVHALGVTTIAGA